MLNSKIVATNIFYRGLNIGVVFLINILLSRLAGVNGYGVLSLLIANAGIFNLLSAFGADSGITYHSASGKLPVSKLLFFILFIVLFQAGALVLTEFCFLSASGPFFLFTEKALAYGWLGLIFLLSISLTEKYAALLSGKQQFSRVSKVLLLSNCFMLIVFSILYFLAGSKSLFFYFTVYIALNLLQAVLMILAYHVWDKNPLQVESPGREDIKLFFSYSFFAFIINVIQLLAYRVDYWLLDYYKGGEELGWYSLAVRLAQFFWIIPLLLAGFIFPAVANRQVNEDDRKMLVLVRGMNMVNIIAGILLFLLIPFLVPFLFGNEYRQSISLFQILLPGVLLFCNATLLAAFFGGKGKLIINFWGSLICLLSVLLPDIFLIPSAGMKGAAFASTAGYAVTAFYFIGIYCYSYKIPVSKLLIPEKNDWSRILNIFKRPN